MGPHRAVSAVCPRWFKPFPTLWHSAHKAYVTRYETNGNPTADPSDLDEGDDLLVIDPTDVRILGRISVSSYATSPPEGGTTQARPDHGVLAGDRVYVTLNSISADFSVTGPGRVLVIDPATDTVTEPSTCPNRRIARHSPRRIPDWPLRLVRRCLRRRRGNQLGPVRRCELDLSAGHRPTPPCGTIPNCPSDAPITSATRRCSARGVRRSWRARSDSGAVVSRTPSRRSPWQTARR